MKGKIKEINKDYFIVTFGVKCKSGFENFEEKILKEDYFFQENDLKIGDKILINAKCYFDKKNNKNKVGIKGVILFKFNSLEKIYGENLDYSTENADLFEEIPQKIVNLFKFAGLTSTKLRQYYQTIVNLYNAFERKKEDDKNINELKTEINLLLAKINYDVNRKNGVPKEVYEFIKFNRDKVLENPNENLKVFKKHFETVVAYAVGKLKN